MKGLLKITASVGKNGVNHPADVRVVQTLLRRDYNYTWLAPDPFVPLNGRIDGATAGAIIKFQRLALRMSLPDGLISPGGRTWKNLVRGVPKNSPPTAPTAEIQSINRWRYQNCVAYMTGEMTTNAQSKTATAIYVANTSVYTKAAAYAAWAVKVKSGGEWDHKPILRRRLLLSEYHDFHFPIAGDNEHEWFYDIWSNIHYGYVGVAVGFTAWELIFGQSAGGIAGRDDPFDPEVVRIGIDLWKTHGKNLKESDLLRGILNREQKLLQIQETEAYLKTIPEKDRGWWRHIIPMNNRQ